MSNPHRHRTDWPQWTVIGGCPEDDEHLSFEAKVTAPRPPFDELREILSDHCPVCGAKYDIIWESESAEVLD